MGEDDHIDRGEDGQFSCQLHLFKGPVNNVIFDLHNIKNDTQKIGGHHPLDKASIALVYPDHIGALARLPVAYCRMETVTEPPHPAFDKRLILGFISANNEDDKNIFLAQRLTECLSLSKENQSQPRQLCATKDMLDELLPHTNLPSDSFALQLPESQNFQCFGPLLPSYADPQKDEPSDLFTLNLEIKVDDPFWQDIFPAAEKDDEAPLQSQTPHIRRDLFLNILLLDSNNNQHFKRPIIIAKNKNPILIIHDGIGQMAPALLKLPPLKQLDLSPQRLHAKDPLLLDLNYPRLNQPSHFMMFASLLNADAPIDIELKPVQKNQVFCAIEPAQISFPVPSTKSLASTNRLEKFGFLFRRPKEQQPTLLPAGIFKTDFQLKVNWPEQNHIFTSAMVLRLNQKDKLEPFCIKIGAETIHMQQGSFQQNLVSKLALTNLKDQAKLSYDAAMLEDSHWRAKQRPFTLSSLLTPWQGPAAVRRLERLKRHYDVGLTKPDSTEQIFENYHHFSNLKSLFLQTTSQLKTKDRLYLTQPKKGATF